MDGNGGYEFEIAVKEEIDDRMAVVSTAEELVGNLQNYNNSDDQFIIEESLSSYVIAKIEPMDDGNDENIGLEESTKYTPDIPQPLVRFICDICKHETRSKKLLRRHIVSHTGAVLKCGLCDYRTHNASSLKKHSWIHSSRKSYACNSCDYHTWNFAAFKTHTWKHTGEKPFACEFCGYRARQIGSLRRHVASQHDAEFGDEERAQVGSSAAVLPSPKTTLDDSDIPRQGGCFLCRACDYKSSTKRLMKVHIMIHSGEKPYACDICDYRCTQKSRLRLHMMVHTGEKPFGCDLCEYRSSTRVLLQGHMKTHTGEKKPKKKQVSCALCDYRCSGYQLSAHMKTHGEPPYTCRHCGYKAVTGEALNAHHKETHAVSEQDPFPCEYCTYSTNHRTHLRDHMLVHTGEKPFACNLCTFRSRQKSQLKLHMLTHTGQKPYACNQCDHRTTQKSHLTTHKKSCGRGRKRKRIKNPPVATAKEPATSAVPFVSDPLAV